jgi:hypothetical protein
VAFGISEPNRHLRAGLFAGLFLAAIGAGCADRPSPPPVSAPSTAADGQLFATGLDDISRLYLDPVTSRQVALAGMARLTRLDGKLGVAGADGAVEVDYGGSRLARFPTPQDGDSRGWGLVVAQVIGAAKTMSASLSELKEGRVETAIFHGVTDQLDRFSRYSPPEEARALSAEWEGSQGQPTVTMSLAGNLAVFRITGFDHRTAERVVAGLTEAERMTGGRLAGIVLDLRGNPGGLLDIAAKLADLFIQKGPIVSTFGRNSESWQVFAASGRGPAPLLPIAVLIDGGSASASEIVAAALQDRGRAIVIGTSSYGKGTVQTVQRLPNGGDLILTWARLVAPSGYLLQHHGVVPTVCTADLAARPEEDAPSLLARLHQAPAPQPRAALDESGWSALRRACPPKLERNPADLKMAERLIVDPALYQAALEALPPPTRLAAGAGRVEDATRSGYLPPRSNQPVRGRPWQKAAPS